MTYEIQAQLIEQMITSITFLAIMDPTSRFVESHKYKLLLSPRYIY